MKLHITLILIASLFATNAAIAQHAGMEGMEGMKGAPQGAKQKKINYQTTAIVKAVDVKKGTVLLAHEAIASLNWPAMTMEFWVENPAMFSKLIVGNKVMVEFMQQGNKSVIVVVQ